MAMDHGSGMKGRTPFDRASLELSALNYAARFATTQRKLRDYLRRKLRERGWAEEGEPPVDALVAHLAELGYVDDRAFARGRTDALYRRGYGERRVDAALRAAGIADEDIEPRESDRAGWEAALRLAERRRIGPFAAYSPDAAGQEKAVAILLRAGHPPARARRIGRSRPGEIPAWDEG